MKTYSLLKFLNEPLDYILDNEADYCFTSIHSDETALRKESNSISKINIPIIQRDYAQGREDNKELREEFIGKLFYHLETKQGLKLDFVYGSLNRTK